MAIKDQQQFKDMDNLLRSLKILQDSLPGLIDASSQDIVKLEKDFSELRDLADEFNEIFASHGWVANGVMSAKAAEEAVRLAKDKGVEVGEQYLEDYYDEDLDHLLRQFFFELLKSPQVKEAETRRRLIYKALDYHRDGDKYDASVLIITTQIDGIVKDLTGKSFYESNDKKLKHLEAYETFAGDPSGLPQLAKAMSQVRKATTGEELDTLHRQGILHRRDLGYDNRRVSTKAFATLVSLKEIIEAIREDRQYIVSEPEVLDPETATWDDVRREWQSVLQMVMDQKGSD
jgi:hypothetical protein